MRRSIDQRAATSARQAQSQAAMMQRDLRALRDSLAGLTSGIHAPKITAKRTKTKTVRTASVLNEALGATDFLTGGALSGAGLVLGNSFYASTSQSASAQSDILSLGQRIR